MDELPVQARLTNEQIRSLHNAFDKRDESKKGTIGSEKIVELIKDVFGPPLNGFLIGYAKDLGKNLSEDGGLSCENFIVVVKHLMFETTRWGMLKTAPEKPIGLDSIQEQVRQKLIRFGLAFNVMVVGTSGLGKSTMMNTLFKSKVNRWVSSDTSEDKLIPATVQIKTISHVIEEKNIRLKLSITDTPGFGDQVNNVKCWEPIIDHINDQYQHYLFEERRIERKPRIPDTRIHCLIYFISPTGHSLKAVDIECLKRLVKVVNVVPVIAKADSLTLEERQAFKNRLRNDFERNGINKLYPMLHKGLEEDEFQKNKTIKGLMPFAVVGSDEYITIKGQPVLARKTRWGTVEVENPSHNEFPQFRDMLLRTHLHDLIDTTAEVYYEHYRRNQLQQMQNDEA